METLKIPNYIPRIADKTIAENMEAFGAVVIEGDRIVAAKCILPVTQSAVPKAYGTRHRAAIGMSEISDAIILVVSEETGGISIAHAGELRRDIAPEKLQQTLQRYLNINTRRRKDKEVAE